MSLFTSYPIAELEPPTKAKIRSTQILTSLPHLISELVQNSLDAGASHVEVGLDPAEWECWVRDDGQGMSAEGLEMLGKGHDKGRYSRLKDTSKPYGSAGVESSTFGFRGEALASAMELSCLEISSRTTRSRESRSVIIKGGEQLYVGPSVHWRRERPGTTVVARDIFFNVPVRRKSHPNVARTLDLTKKELETLALVFPHVSFSLDHTRTGHQNRILTIARTTSSLASFRAIYGATLAGHAEEINLRSEDLRLEGFISLEGSQSRAFQNFYVNKHPMTFGDLQRAVEKCFASSVYRQPSLGEQGHYKNARRSPRKVEKRPVYVLNLSISPLQVDNFVEPAKSMVQFQDMNRVLAFILEGLNRVLSKNNISTRQPPIGIDLGSPLKRVRRDGPQSVPNSRQRVHSATKAPNMRNRASLPFSPLDEGLRVQHVACEPTDNHKILASFDDSGFFEWIDPSSGESFLVDSKTGNSFSSNRLPSRLCEDSNNASSEDERYKRRSLKPGCSSSNPEGDKADKIPAWLTKAMQHNPTFRPAEQVVFSTKYLDTVSQESKHYTHTRGSWEGIRSSNLSQSSKVASDTFSANDLKDAQVVAQVDTKFIACLLQRSDHILALVDQHAADERVRVEKYLKSLCSGFLRGEVEILQTIKPRAVLLTRREAEILAGYTLDIMGRWGVRIESDVSISQAPPPTQGTEFVQIGIASVPDVVASKLTSERELGNFVKAMLAAIDTSEYDPLPVVSFDIQDQKDWVKALRYCPAPLLELVNSKACRGAIMFNDPLDWDQCQRLIHQLSETVFPFQCAHGRPSIAPLTKLPRVNPKSSVVDWEAFDQEDW